MFARTFDPRQLLRRLHGTEPFAEYCASRGLRFESQPNRATERERVARWQAVLSKLPESEQARVELELRKVNALANTDATSRLVAAAGGSDLPPDTVPGGGPLALWFLLNKPELFEEAFLRQEIAHTGLWRTAYAPAGLAVRDLDGCRQALTDSLREYFRYTDGTGRFTAVDAHTVGRSVCFAAYLSDRLKLLEGFDSEGRRTTRATRPSFPVIFMYDPDDGRLLLRSRLRAPSRVLDLFQRCGEAVLGVEIGARNLAPWYRLDVLKRRFDPPRDELVDQVRVKSLTLVYPGRDGRRRVRLEALSGDAPSAILELLERHGGGPDTLDRLVVLAAELQVKLRVDGRLQSHLIRLSHDSCNLDQTPVGRHLHACLKRWGIAHGP
jgi:hypothetical protein